MQRRGHAGRSRHHAGAAGGTVGPALALAAALWSVAHAAAGETACTREPKRIQWDGDTEEIYAAPKQWVEVIFPEALVGTLPEKASGITIRPVPVGANPESPLNNRVYIQVAKDTYNGGVYFHSKSGESYHLQVLARPDCANTQVTVVDTRVDDKREQDQASRRSGGKLGLVEHLYLGKVPEGFHRKTVDKPKAERRVFKQGSIVFHLEEIWRGPQRTGFILRVTNRGRTPYEVSLQSIDFSHPKLEKAFGNVREIAMEPFDRRLGPAPEFATDALHPQNKGLIYIMATERSEPGAS